MNEIARDIIDSTLKDAISKRYLSYAMSTITSRSLPDLRDGLKPVHRRILFSMLELKLNPKSKYKKSARIVGDVMGKFHPHGDSAIYDAMVRLSQDFSVRYPLVDGQGNFGNIDGDNPAAMRYTEAKFTEITEEMLRGMDENAVDFRETYDGESLEPVVLPSYVPNILMNGATGIAVGMATSIPPHNLGELCKAIIKLINNPDITIKEIVKIIKGPDFPTGGVVCEDFDDMLSAYQTGRGGFRLRSRWEVENTEQGKWQIVVTEIPYQVQKSKLIEQIADIIETKKVQILADVRDESAEDIRIVLEPKSKNIDPNILMEALFKHSMLENKFSLNMNVLSDKGRVPKVLDIKAILVEYVSHRKEILERIYTHKKNKIERRLEILDGYLIAYLNIDEIISIIRNEDAPKSIMVSRFNLTEIQVESILNMRLRVLRKLEEIEIKKEYDMLSETLGEIKKLLSSDDLKFAQIIKEQEEILEKYSKGLLGKRRTKIDGKPEDFGDLTEVLIEKENITVVYTQNGWMKSLKGHLNISDIKEKDDDKILNAIHCTNIDTILVFTKEGKFYSLKTDKVPGGRGNGEHINILLELSGDEKIVKMLKYDDSQKLLVTSSEGKGFVVESKNVIANTKNGKNVLKVSDGFEAFSCNVVNGGRIVLLSNKNKMIIFNIDEISILNKGKGVTLQKYKDSVLANISVFNKFEDIEWEYKFKGDLKIKDFKKFVAKRGGIGKLISGLPEFDTFL